MTRKEIVQLLKILADNYTNNRISDPEGTVKVWELSLGSFPAEQIYKAARLHMAKSPFFPTPAELIEKIPRAEIIYTQTSRPQLEQKKIQPSREPEDREGCQFCPYYDDCQKKECAFE